MKQQVKQTAIVIGLIAASIAGLSTLAIAQQQSPQPQQSQPTAQNEQQILASIYDNVLQKNAHNAVNACQMLSKTLQNTTAGERTKNLHQDFRNLALAWKKVEATYIAGELDINATDIPRHLDIFHIGNENIREQMQKVVNNNQPPNVALFKNSYKTINALEAVLYQDDSLSERELQLATAINDNICRQLTAIDDTYKAQKPQFLAEPKKSLSMLINTLASQSHFLKEWRIADVAGLSKKYDNKPSGERAEFYLSGLSLDAIKAILDTQSELITPQDYANLVQIAQIYNAEPVLADNQVLLNNAKSQLRELTPDILASRQQATVALYNTVNQLQSGYYQNLIHALPVAAVILEADGD
ncbi:hypothetical protein MOMA_02120 [Moraxella macacae 0408225]|uniref:Imelysin-like domain-containing protein n=1 Tax=Moraxella macacae 0408225 TaxID=1230338 RepID=L2F8F0_9GAMM|nr:hypothetical protein [Moraxella macacae]ELA09165.1 hypothetical protein MOMA_02120 [Moraxella macacae 0408225]